MPELPEVETVKRGLFRLITKKTIISVKSDNPKSFPNPQNNVDVFLINSSVINVRRRAKVLMIDLSTNYTLVTHLKMTGQLVFVDNNERFGAGHPNDSLIGKLPDKSTRVEFEFSDGSHLYFNDQRKFGWVKLIPTPEIMNIPFMQRVGPEPLEDDFKLDDFIVRFKRRQRTNIKAAILDQSVIAGVGNIYADESLWAAKINPKRLVGSITDDEFGSLYKHVREIMKLSIEKGGSTNRNYVDAEGNKGSYMSYAKVFRREGKECYRCGCEIEKIRVAGRGTHICPNCQTM